MHSILKSAAAALALIFLASCVKESRGGESILAEGDRLPSFALYGPDDSGWAISSDDFEGRGGLVVLFASYCPDCREELPEIERLWKASDGGSLFALATISRQMSGETPETVATYWAAERYTMPYYMDTAGEVYGLFASKWIPRIYVIDRNKKITFMTVSRSDVTAEEIAAELEKALGISVALP